MAKASRRQTNLADRQLAGIDLEEAKRKWREGLPVTLKQMSAALELDYSTVRNYSQMAGFPMLNGCLLPRLFETWFKGCIGAQSLGTSEIPREGFTVQTGNDIETALDKNSANSQNDPDDFLDREELAKRIRCSVSQVENLKDSGLIPYLKVRGMVRFHWPSVLFVLLRDCHRGASTPTLRQIHEQVGLIRTQEQTAILHRVENLIRLLEIALRER